MQGQIQVGVNVWRWVEGLMANRKILRKLKGKVLFSYGTPAYLYGLETVALKERTIKAAGLREQLGHEDCSREEGG